MDSTPDMEYNCLFVGNPGAGKSTLLNCLMKARDPSLDGDELFKSGVSICEGLTFQFDHRKVGKITFMDTPGLEDTKLREQAAKAISDALKKGGYYRVVFVVTLESGRVRPQDVTVVNLVLESAPEINRYGVIFNKLTKGVIKTLDKDPNNRNKLISQVSLQASEHQNRPVPIPFFLHKIEDLEDLDDVTTEIPELEEFMPMVPLLRIHAEQVQDIETDKYEKYAKQLEEQLTLLKSSNEEMAKRMEKDKEEYEQRIKEIMEEDRRRHEEEMTRIQQQNERQMTLMQEKEEEHIKQLEKIHADNAEKHAAALAKMEENFRSEKQQMMQMHNEQKANQDKMFKQMQAQNEHQMRMMSSGGGPGLICCIS